MLKVSKKYMSIEAIAKRAAEACAKLDSQHAENEAFEEALDFGLPERECEEAAKLAGILHNKFNPLNS